MVLFTLPSLNSTVLESGLCDKQLTFVEPVTLYCPKQYNINKSITIFFFLFHKQSPKVGRKSKGKGVRPKSSGVQFIDSLKVDSYEGPSEDEVEKMVQEEVRRRAESRAGFFSLHFFSLTIWSLKSMDTQRPVFSLSVSQHMHKTTNP